MEELVKLYREFNEFCIDMAWAIEDYISDGDMEINNYFQKVPVYVERLHAVGIDRDWSEITILSVPMLDGERRGKWFEPYGRVLAELTDYCLQCLRQKLGYMEDVTKLPYKEYFHHSRLSAFGEKLWKCGVRRIYVGNAEGLLILTYHSLRKQLRCGDYILQMAEQFYPEYKWVVSIVDAVDTVYKPNELILLYDCWNNHASF